MDARRLLGRLFGWNRNSNRGLSRLRRNAVELVTHPLRTLYSIVFMTGLFSVLYTIFYETGATTEIGAAEGDALATALAFLPPFHILALIAVAMTILVPVTMLFRGVTSDDRYYE